MNNYVSLFVATLEHLEVITESEAKKLAKELVSSTLPDSYEAASLMVKKVINDLEIKKLSHKFAKAKQVDSANA